MDDIQDIELDPIDGGVPSDEQRTRRRLIAATAAAALIAGAVGGYLVGRVVDGGAAGSAAAPEVTEPVADTVAEREVPPAAELDTPAVTMEAPLGAGDAISSRMGSGGVGWSMYGAGPLETLAERTTPSGLLLRAQLGETWETADDWGVPGWKPAPWCFESGQMRIALAGNGLIDVGTVPWYREPYQGRAVSSVVLGSADSQPHVVVVVQVPPDATSVTVTFADGAVDTTAPQNGIALLAAPGALPAANGAGEDLYWQPVMPDFDVVIEGGASAGTLSSDGIGTWADPEFQDACTPPPPALPDPGEQPADAETARATIVGMMTALYDASIVGEGVDFLDDPTGVAEAGEQVAQGAYADQAASAQAVIEELVFTSPTEAWFRYRIDTDGARFDDRYGIAVVIDGNWKITRATVCQDLALAGGACGGGWEQILPPSARERMYDIDGEMSAD